MSMQHGVAYRRNVSPVWLDPGDIIFKPKSAEPFSGSDSASGSSGQKKSRSSSCVSDAAGEGVARRGWVSSEAPKSAPDKKCRSQSSGSEAGSLDSQGSLVQQQVRQVMGDLVSVLGELRTVVGDIKTLVTQIDVVTHRIDESVSGDEMRRRASDSRVDVQTLSTQDRRNTERPASYHSASPAPRLSDRDYVNLTYSTDGKLVTGDTAAYTTTAYITSGNTNANINGKLLDNQTFQTPIYANNNSNSYTASSGNNNRPESHNKSVHNLNDHNNQPSKNNQSEPTRQKTEKPPKPLKPLRLCSKKKEHALSVLSLIDSPGDSSPDSLVSDASTQPVYSERKKSTGATPRDMYIRRDTGVALSDTYNRRHPESAHCQNNKNLGAEKSLNKSNSCLDSWAAQSTTSDYSSRTTEATPSPVSDYSGLYEREMEDCLELEISECHDLVDPNIEECRSVDSRQDESDDYVDWTQRQVDLARKQAEVVAWTRSSWAGHELYKVSLDNSVAYSDDVTDGEPDHDTDTKPRHVRSPKHWNRFLPPTMNQHVVNFSWRTVVEP